LTKGGKLGIILYNEERMREKTAVDDKLIFFEVSYNRHRPVFPTPEPILQDEYREGKCRCVLALPEHDGKGQGKTPLILSFHGAGSTVCQETGEVGGISYADACREAGYAVLDVAGAAPDGLTMGCPEHIFAAYKAYRYAVTHFELQERVLIAGASMGGHVGMNFLNTYPSIVLAAGFFFPRLNMDSCEVNGHFCLGTWDKTNKRADGESIRDKICRYYHFPDGQWHEENTVGFNPYRSRSFINADGERVVIPPCPIKIWQGMEDETVSPAMTEEFIRCIRRGGGFGEFRPIAGVAHKVHPVMKEELRHWFDRFI